MYIIYVIFFKYTFNYLLSHNGWSLNYITIHIHGIMSQESLYIQLKLIHVLYLNLTEYTFLLIENIKIFYIFNIFSLSIFYMINIYKLREIL